MSIPRESSVPKDRGNLKVVLVLTGSAVFIAVAALFLLMVSRENDKRQELETAVGRGLMEAAVRRGPGAAWAEYAKAIEDAALIQKDDLLTKYLEGRESVDRRELEQIVAERTQALEFLREGTRRSKGETFYPWARGRQMKFPNIQKMETLADLAVTQARILAEQGRVPEAAELLEDVLVFAGDIGRNGTRFSSFVAVGIYDLALNEAQSLIVANKLRPKELAHLIARLETTDRDFPLLKDVLRNDALMFGMSALERMQRWSPEDGLPVQSVSADAFNEIQDLYRRGENFDHETFAKVTLDVSRIEADAAKSANPLVRQGVPSVTALVVAHRAARALLRIVRAAAVYRATGEFPELDDPFGGKLLHRIENGKVKIWSVGKDGMDEGGHGTWNQPKAKDIVLEMPQ